MQDRERRRQDQRNGERDVDNAASSHVVLITRAASRSPGPAAEAGFADQSHMTRQFKRAYGRTPAAWAKAVRTGLTPVRPPLPG
jgi:methylphosphotriester-DNA--protein-cysteine methyltransferase